MSGPKTPVSSPPKLGRLAKALTETPSSRIINDTEMTDVSDTRSSGSKTAAVATSERVLRLSPKKKVGFESGSNDPDSSPTRPTRTTPEKRDSLGSIPVSIPYTPTLKRTSSGHYKLPEYMHKLALPRLESKNVLKTPRPYDSDDDDDDDDRPMFRPQKTFLSPVGKRLAFDQTGNPVVSTAVKDPNDISEISSVLKLKLTSALGKIQQQNLERQLQRQIQFNQLLNTMSSPTKKVKKRPASMPNPSPSINSHFAALGATSSHPPASPLPGLPGSANRNLNNGANLNLKTLQQSPVSYPHHYRHSHHYHPIHNMPSPDEEQSAHNALMIALARVGGDRESPRKANAPTGIDTRVISTVGTSPAKRRNSLNLRRSSLITSLPPIVTNANAKGTDSQTQEKTASESSTTNGEQEAIMSLMQLSSPRNLHGGLITAATPDNDETDVEDITEDEEADDETESKTSDDKTR